MAPILSFVCRLTPRNASIGSCETRARSDSSARGGGPLLKSEDDRGDKQPSVGDQHLESGAEARLHDLRLLCPVLAMWLHTG